MVEKSRPSFCRFMVLGGIFTENIRMPNTYSKLLRIADVRNVFGFHARRNMLLLALSNYLRTNNNEKSNLAKGGIVVASPPKSLFVFARWEHRTDGLIII